VGTQIKHKGFKEIKHKNEKKSNEIGLFVQEFFQITNMYTFINV